MTKSDVAAKINRNGIQPDNFTQIPNMAFTDLKPNAFKLLAVYLDISKSGDVYAKNSTIAKMLGSSVNTMKAARKELADKRYILLAPGKDGVDTKTASITVQIAWMWEENHKRQTVSKSDTPLSNSDTMLSKIDTPSNQDLYNKTDISKKEIPPTPKPIEKANAALQVMKGAVKQLKAYGKDSDRVAKTLLNMYEESDKNIGGEPFNPDDIPAFISWYQVECPGYTLPRNSQSCVKWINLWRDSKQDRVKQITVLETQRRNAKLPLNISSLESA